ncbi:nuclear pore complex component-domain-containing protein [Podospora aff. communis PSN243]|uniref:Nuclear pore complex component-domain-containing protein n=1 Tax=Podospora aff. communis PSN243 TaxID=3040156 RepID=A0AAV9GZ18_9PEZI|nr:nuclear pore complex component-domain-containing protein [Podospora aff. communis PSN243]
MSSTLSPVSRTTLTPVKQTAVTPVKESPGNWRHPKLAEITRRQSKTVFSEKEVKQIVYNVLALAVLFLVRTTVRPHWPAKLLSTEMKQYGGWIYIALTIIPLFNIGRALLPLVRPKDDLSDIPLTPAQRKLLGLPPSSKPATPGSAYSTPPRYSRTPSIAGSPASARSYASSPTPNLTSPSPLPNSPSAASPLLQKAVNGARRSSFGSPGLLGASTATSLFGDGPATPTPAAGKRSSVSLNNKWLYEKGRRSSGNSWLHQGL